jgi:hypothetical protein
MELKLEVIDLLSMYSASRFAQLRLLLIYETQFLYLRPIQFQ